MRIIQINPGSGDRFYCENCVRDNALARALKAAGQDVVVAPMYLPQIADPLEIASGMPVFFGGVNTYLQQNYGFFRHTPGWLDRLFDSGPLLRMAARRAGSVRASGLGEMTLSILKGADGNQAKELRRLLTWLEKMDRPDVVHLSTPLLLGIGAEIKRRLATPVVCSLQDEDAWIDAMEDPSRAGCWRALTEGARDVDAFIAPSRFFGEVMRERMKIDPARLHHIHVGIDAGAPPGARPATPAIGFLARMSAVMGLGALADAFLLLRKEERFKSLRLHLCGGSTDDDAPFLQDLRRRFDAAGVSADVQFFEDFDPAARRRFLESLSVLSVPSPHGSAYGTYILEALAAGVPVVQPRLGSFPELVEATSGGLLVDPADRDALSRGLADLLADAARAAELGRRGRDSVVKDFSLEMMAKSMIAVYRGVVPTKTPAAGGRP